MHSDSFDYPIVWFLIGTVGLLLAPAMWIVPAAILLVAHAVGIVWRARSAWLVVDFVALVAVAAGAFVGAVAVSALPAGQTGLVGTLWLLGWGLLGLIAAGACQLSFGRVDLRRAHRTLSAALWCVLGVGVAALVGWSGWVRAATPADLLRVEQVAVTSGTGSRSNGSAFGRFDYYPRFVAQRGQWAVAAGRMGAFVLPVLGRPCGSPGTVSTSSGRSRRWGTTGI